MDVKPTNSRYSFIAAETLESENIVMRVGTMLDLLKAKRECIIPVLFFSFILVVCGCNRSSTQGDSMLSGIGGGKVDYRDGTLVIRTSAADQVAWPSGGFNVVLESYYKKDYRININKHLIGKIAVRGLDAESSLAYNGAFFNNLSNIPASVMNNALLKFKYSDTQFWDLYEGALKFFIAGYLEEASQGQKGSLFAFDSVSGTASEEKFDQSLALFLNSLPAK